MAESDWLTSADPVAMLKLLDGRHWVIDNRRNRAGVDSFLLRTPSDRQLRLFACACCRAVWHLLTDPRSRRAVEVAERFADGLATEEELNSAQIAAAEVARPIGTFVAEFLPAIASMPEPYSALNLARDMRFYFDLIRPTTQTNLLRDIIGNPFRAVTIAPSWLTWRDGIIQRLAEQAYQERCETGELDPARLQMLADALEESWCNNETILSHLRSPGPHVRGCWAIDSLLRKK